MKTSLTLLIIAGLILLIIFGPLMMIWSLNTLFSLNIAYSFWTWLSVAFFNFSLNIAYSFWTWLSVAFFNATIFSAAKQGK